MDISGWKVSGSIEHTFKAGTVVPAGDRLFLTSNVMGFRNRAANPKGGEALFVQGNYSGVLAAGGQVSIVNSANKVVVSAVTPQPAGGFADWLAQYFDAGSPDAAEGADPDGDGSKNSVEFALGTHPGRYSTPEMEVRLVDVDGKNHLEVSVSIAKAATADFELQQSETLANDWTSIATTSSTNAIEGKADLETLVLRTTEPVAGPSLYLRLTLK